MQRILILDFGGQYNQLIARRIRECHVYCEVHPARVMTAPAVREFAPIGIILAGGLYGTVQPTLDPEIFRLGIPVLAIGCGFRLMVEAMGGRVAAQTDGEYSRVLTRLNTSSSLFRDCPESTVTWMCHGASLSQPPRGFIPIAGTAACPVAAMADPERQLYGLAFHPEVPQTDGGTAILRSFLYDICDADGDWVIEEYARTAVAQLQKQIGSRRVLLALSGGVDSSVAAALLSRAVGGQLTCIFVDHGLLRKNEGDAVEAVFSNMPLHFIRVNAAERFLSKLSGVTDPEAKRKIIGDEFVAVFREEAKKLGKIDFLAQGTIYPDVMAPTDSAAMIKSYHDVGALSDCMDFQAAVEPLRQLFKDEVRELGRAMGLPEELVSRQPFPGPGLAIRIIGEITREKLAALREADYIFRDILEKARMHRQLGQYFAVLTNTRSVGLRDEERASLHTLALRAVTTDDFMTAKWARIPYELLDKISADIIRSVPSITRVVYDITSKPPAAIEWE